MAFEYLILQIIKLAIYVVIMLRYPRPTLDVETNVMKISNLGTFYRLKNLFIYAELGINSIISFVRPFSRVYITILLLVPQFSVSVFITFLPQSLGSLITNTSMLALYYFLQIGYFTNKLRVGLIGLVLVQLFLMYYYLVLNVNHQPVNER